MTTLPFRPDKALLVLEAQIRTAWLDVRRDKRTEALAMRSFEGKNEIAVDIADGPNGQPFACEPSLGLIHMKWWALETLWLAAYAFHELGGRLTSNAKGGNIECEINTDPTLKRARDSLAHACFIIENRCSIDWPTSLPHPSDGSGGAKQATATFLVALGWIQQHEVKHIIIDRSLIGNDEIQEERECDHHATQWVLKDASNLQNLNEGVAVALFLLILRESLNGKGPETHPSSSERVYNSQITPRHANWLTVMIEFLLQSGGHQTPATAGVAFKSPMDLLVTELVILEEILIASAKKRE